jgi:nucleoside-diphosphate-sugar epimerase
MSADGPVLVTGAGGFLGRHVVAAVERCGRAPVEVPHRWQQVDDVVRTAEQSGVTSCVHLGWYADPRDYLTAVGPNAASLHDTLALARGLDEVGVERLVVTGSSVEHAPSTEPLAEDAPVVPRTVYGSAKALCHELLRTAERPALTRVTWARLFNVVGPGERPGRILPSVARALLTGTPFDLSEGTQVRDYVDVRDVADALVRLAVPTAPDVVNVGTGVGTALRDVLLAMADQVDGRELLRFGVRPFLPEDNPVVVADTGRLRREVGWVPQRSLQETAADVLDHWRHYDG